MPRARAGSRSGPGTTRTQAWMPAGPTLTDASDPSRPTRQSALVLRASRLGFESFLVLIGYPLWLAAWWFMGSAFGELMLQVTRLRSVGAGEVIEDAAWDLERRGGCLLCINVDSESRACLLAGGDHAVLMDDASQLLAPRVTSGLRPEVGDGTALGLVGGAPQAKLKALDTA